MSPSMPVSILRNTLLSPAYTEKMLAMPRVDEACASLLEIFDRFRSMKDSASEIQTEIHLVKPILKVLGYSVEPKPKFFEDHVKGPDFALFCSEEDRLATSNRWGTKEFFRNAVALLSVKRYGRNLAEGITGFYLDFENRIPLYQIMYLTKRSDTPWGILTNGKNWILCRKPRSFEKRLIELSLDDLDSPQTEGTLHLFCQLFSCMGLKEHLPALFEEERAALIDILKETKASIAKLLQGVTKKSEIYPLLIPYYKELFPDSLLPLTDAYLKERGAAAPFPRRSRSGRLLNGHDEPDVLTYLFTRKDVSISFSVEDAIVEGAKEVLTKEALFALRILDLTPGFGAVAAHLVEGLTYLSLTLPYREKNTFVAEWENETTLNRCILDTLLYGVEKSPLALDILQNSMMSRFHEKATNYRFGDALLGMSLSNLEGLFETKSQRDLFSRPSPLIIQEFRDMYRLYFSLSDRIKEDIEVKRELEVKLARYTERLRDILDLLTASYFTKKSDEKKVKDLLHSLDSDESKWQRVRGEQWFGSAKMLALRNSFFHMELEFPLLLNGAFDMVVVQPWLAYAWEEKVPVMEMTKAYIKRASAYIKPGGKILLVSGDNTAKMADELAKSKKYDLTQKTTWILLRKA
jgi:hypothetical protein